VNLDQSVGTRSNKDLLQFGSFLFDLIERIKLWIEKEDSRLLSLAGIQDHFIDTIEWCQVIVTLCIFESVNKHTEGAKYLLNQLFLKFHKIPSRKMAPRSKFQDIRIKTKDF